ncbi:Hypothetical_protein [Hexamita inflata]|uniref:Hypothetical_protein n=1 Tax=Hexamita inflata TaxID=28002 RepID=A0AA86RHI9_9EUKA|nr:Hypothetical protein HINF_LOCUS54715 [Hexamita inflata]
MRALENKVLLLFIFFVLIFLNALNCKPTLLICTSSGSEIAEPATMFMKAQSVHHRVLLELLLPFMKTAQQHFLLNILCFFRIDLQPKYLAYTLKFICPSTHLRICEE